MRTFRKLLLLVLAVACILGVAITANAVNPYMSLWEHVPDAEPYVFEDPDHPGEYRVYVYGSHDVFESRMCGPNYVTWSAPVDDLSDWRYEGIIFDGGESGYLLAPDVCQGPDGKYYLYAWGDCDQGGKMSSIVAVSDRPDGPFEYVGATVWQDGTKVSLFDPAVLYDEDTGKVWLFGGSAQIYELDPADMCTIIDGPYTVQERDEEGELVTIRNFMEGSSIRKIGDWYVFVYAAQHEFDDQWVSNVPYNTDHYTGTLEYAYSKNITGPYTYGGVVVDNGGELLEGVDEEGYPLKSNYNGNTHGGICEIEGQWYVFYHRQTTAVQTYRQAMCDPITLTYDDEGVYITQAEVTSQGAELDGLDAEAEYSAGIACYLTQRAYVDTDVEMGEEVTPVVNIKDGAVVGYKYLNFGAEGKYYDLLLEVKPTGVNGTIDVVLDDPDNEPVATFTLEAKSSDFFHTLQRECGKISGTHAVFFVFHSDSDDVICEFGTFAFRETNPGGVTQTLFNPGTDGCQHNYVRAEDSYESTDTEAGYRHFECTLCDAEYAYTTDPKVYVDGFEKYDGTVVEVNEGNLGASNPVLPMNIYDCDGEPKVNWSKEDGEWRVYLYASWDMKETGYCGPQCIIYSAPVYDLSDWRFESTPNSAMASLAPDCQYNPYDDHYYFVKNLPGEIWKSTMPGKGFDDVKVFTDGDASNPNGISMFDSAMYITEDGTMYIFSCQLDTYYVVSVLKPEDQYSKMSENYYLSTDAVDERDPKDFAYIYEGPSIRYLEDEDVYVLVYASQYVKDNGDKWESVLSYAYTDDIRNTEWTYGGIVLDTGGHFLKDADGTVVKDETSPTWNFDNNHGGMAEINGKWYIFGHRNTYYTTGSRQGWAEKLTVAYEDGKLTIDPVEMTSSGVADYLDGFAALSAYHACYMTPAVDTGNESAGIYVSKIWNDETSEPVNEPHSFPIVGISHGAEIGFKYLNFGSTRQDADLSILVAKEAGYVDGTVTVYLDAPTAEAGGIRIGSIDLSNDAVSAASTVATGADGTQWKELTARMDVALSGTHAVYFVFSAADEGTICKFDQLDFDGTGDISAAASLTGSSDAQDNTAVDYTVNVGNVQQLMTVTAELAFEGDSFTAAHDCVTGLNGFEVLGNVEWTSDDTIRVTLINNEGFSTDEALALLNLQLTANPAAENGTVTLTGLTLSGRGADGAPAYFAYHMVDGQDTVTSHFYASIYDVNRDGVVDQLDITAAQLSYSAREGEAGWDDAAIRADVNGDGLVGIDDLILILNHIDW